MEMAAYSSINLGLPSTYAKVAATPVARFRHRDFLARYRGAMPFIA